MRVLMIALMTILLSGVNVAPAMAQHDDKGREARLGGTRESIADVYGDPKTDAKDAVAEYEVVDYGTFQVTYHKNRVLQFTIFAEGDAAPVSAAFGDNWEAGEALSIARRFLPKDAKVRDQLHLTDDDNVVYEITSEALKDTFSMATYERYDVGGDQGDAYVLLYLSEDGTAYAMDIFIGSADDATEGRWDAKTDDDEITEAEQEYIDGVRDEIYTVRKASSELIPLFEDMKTGEDEWTIKVVAQLVTYQLTYEQAVVEPAPTSRMQSIQGGLNPFDRTTVKVNPSSS